MIRDLLLSISLLVLIVGSVMIFGGDNSMSEEAAPMVRQELPQRIRVTGTWECVPLKNGLLDDECVLGIVRDQSDVHFIVDTMLMSTIAEVAVGEQVQVEGVFTPAAALSSDHWQQYPIEGIISATVIQKI